jgi:glycine/D-amino acid oxidase-like deaminating enzyme
MKRNITILGAGVNGLSCAISILSKWSDLYDVTILAEKFTPETTSDGSGGLWLPYAAEPREKINKWGKICVPILKRIIKENPKLGAVSELRLLYHDKPDFSVFSDMEEFRELKLSEIPDVCNYGCSLKSPTMISWRYMKFLTREVYRLGGRFRRYKVESIESLNNDYPETDLFINCLGLGAGKIFDDPRIVPGRGVIIRAKEKEGKRIGKVYGFEDDPEGITYIISRDDYCILGGTYNEGNYSTNYSEDEIKDIIRRCTRIAPELQLESVERVWVGLRPIRDSLRLEMDYSQSKPIIHNYGHGGSGITIHWGCAQEVTSLLDEHFSSCSPKL